MSFDSDITQRDSALFPVVTFNLINGDKYHISTIQFTFPNPDGDGTTYTPLLLSSPSIKESIDLENRNYKISSVSLNISNLRYDGIIFSDTIMPYNTGVTIHWVSPSCHELDDCYLAYSGEVRASAHDEKTCNITLEDISQSILHRDVPIAVLGTGNDVPEKYKNKPVPIVYGDVDKSPIVISKWGDVEGDLVDISILCDRTQSINNSDTVALEEVVNLGTNVLAVNTDTGWTDGTNTSYLMLSEDGNDSYVLSDVYHTGTPDSGYYTWSDNVDYIKQFTLEGDNSIRGYSLRTSASAQGVNDDGDVIYTSFSNPLYRNTAQAVINFSISPTFAAYDEEYKLGEVTKNLLTNIYSGTSTFSAGVLGVLAYPSTPFNWSEFSISGDIDWQAEPMPGIYWDEGSTMLTILETGDIEYQKIDINLPILPKIEEKSFQIMTHYIHTIHSQISGCSDNATGYSGRTYLYPSWYPNTGALGYPIIDYGITPDGVTVDIAPADGTWFEGTYGTGNPQVTSPELFGDETVTVSITHLPPMFHQMKIDKFKYYFKTAAFYHIKDFSGQKYYAHVKGRIS